MSSLLRLRRLGDAMLRNGENACYNVYVESRSAVMDKALQVRVGVRPRIKDDNWGRAGHRSEH